MLMPEVWMSFSATPAARIAAITRDICAAFSRMAALASAAWVTTPAEAVAMSGARLDSPRADTESRVPSLLAWRAGVCAAAGMARLPRASANARARDWVAWGMVVSGKGQGQGLVRASERAVSRNGVATARADGGGAGTVSFRDAPPCLEIPAPAT